MRAAAIFCACALVTACSNGDRIDASDVAKLDVQTTPDAMAGKLRGADKNGTRVYASFKKDAFFDQLQLDWNGSDGRNAPQWIALEATKKATADERSRLAEVLHGGLLPGDAWTFGPIRIALKANGSLEGTVDPKPGGLKNPLFEKQSEILLRIFVHAAFGEPLDVSADDMRDAFGGGYPVASLAKIDPTTATKDAAAHVTSIFPGASPNDSHVALAVDHPVALFLVLEWNEAATGTLEKVVLTAPFGANHDAFAACAKKIVSDAKLDVAGSVGTLSADGGISKDAWKSFVAALDACR